AMAELLHETGWPYELAALAADAVGCHHGERANPTTLYALEGNRRALGNSDWADARHGLFKSIHEVFHPNEMPVKESLSGPDFMLLSGLTSFADWIGSNEDWFLFGTPEDCGALQGWF